MCPNRKLSSYGFNSSEIITFQLNVLTKYKGHLKKKNPIQKNNIDVIFRWRCFAKITSAFTVTRTKDGKVDDLEFRMLPPPTLK